MRSPVSVSVCYICLFDGDKHFSNTWVGGKHFLIGGGNAHDGVDEKMDVS